MVFSSFHNKVSHVGCQHAMWRKMLSATLGSPVLYGTFGNGTPIIVG